MLEDFENILNHLILPHWPFISWMTIAALIGHVMERSVFTRERALTKDKYQTFWNFSYKTLAVHPVLAGLVLGLIWDEPEPDMHKLPARMTYFALAGALSNVFFSVVKKFAQKEGIDLTLPGETVAPPKPVAVAAAPARDTLPAPADEVTEAPAAEEAPKDDK